MGTKTITYYHLSDKNFYKSSENTYKNASWILKFQINYYFLVDDFSAFEKGSDITWKN